MEKIITIGETEVRLNNNVAWVMEYRDQFGKDILPVVMPILTAMIEGVSNVLAEADTGEELTAKAIAEIFAGRSLDVLLPLYQAEFVDLVINVAWSMAKAADENTEPPKKWVRKFEAFPLDVIAPELLELVLKGFVSSKNLERLEQIRKRLQPSQPTT